jgi:hypothetical protein
VWVIEHAVLQSPTIPYNASLILLNDFAYRLSSGAPADDCDPFAIQNYIDRLAAEVYDSINPPKDDKIQEDKDEWELMKDKAKSVPFQDVTLSIALKHGLLDEVKKENANKSFEKDNILTIMKVRDDFLREHADANTFEYQWQVCHLAHHNILPITS